MTATDTAVVVFFYILICAGCLFLIGKAYQASKKNNDALGFWAIILIGTILAFSGAYGYAHHINNFNLPTLLH